MDRMEKFLITLLVLCVIALVGLVGWGIYTEVNSLGIKTSEGEAVTTNCWYTPAHRSIQMIGGKVPISRYHPEKWTLEMRIGNKKDSLNVTEATCRVPAGTVYKVRYGYGRLNGILIIKGFSP